MTRFFFFLMEVILNYVTNSPGRMGSPDLVFEVHYRGRFNMHFGCEYVGGEVAVHHETYDPEKLSFFDIEGILKQYGYRSRHLMYFRDPKKSLVDGLHVITSDHDVLYLSSCHIVLIFDLILSSFGVGHSSMISW
jgi:hypothetical protein